MSLMVVMSYCSSFILLISLFFLSELNLIAASEASDASVCFYVLCRTDDAYSTLRIVSVSLIPNTDDLDMIQNKTKPPLLS